MSRQGLNSLLQLAFFPLLALLLLAGHAHGQSATRIMPLGDSITGSPGCWRAMLWNQLQSGGYKKIDFVGTLPTQGCGQSHDGNNEGHGGILATNLASSGQLSSWLSSTNPQVVLMHLGTNDVWSNRSTSAILSAFDALVSQMRANNPTMKILVAQIIPMDAARSCSGCAQGVINLNNALPSWAANKSTSSSPIVVVDQWSGFSVSSHTYDGVHPNSAGDQLIADNWYQPLTDALDGGNTTPDNYPPLACFTGTSTVLPGATASFNGACSSDPDGDSLSYSWSFGDGTNATGVSVQHAFSQAGSFNVTLTVNDGQGNSHNALRTVTVTGSSSASSSSASSVNGTSSCNWYGTLYPLCTSTQSGWGWENNRSCTAVATCASQPAPYGIVGGSSSASSRSSSSRSTSSIASSVSSSVLSSSSSSRSSVSSSVRSSSSVASSSSSSSSSSIAAGASCEYVLTNQWSTGFTGAIRITNNGKNAINGWAVSWTYTDASRITSNWNSNLSGTNPYTASNIGWNGIIQPGQSVEFGFQGTKTDGTAALPSITGSVCN